MKKSKLLVLSLLCLVSCGEDERTAEGWCLYEIKKHSGYENIDSWYSVELETNESEKDFRYVKEQFYFVVFTDKKTEWLCGIEYKRTAFKFMPSSYIIGIDCDIIEK